MAGRISLIKLTSTNSEILFAFTEKLPIEYSHKPIVISGPESLKEAHHEYLLLKENDTIQNVYEIKYLSSSGPYKEAVLLNNLLAVGHYQFLYLYNIINNVNILRLELYGYFEHLYVNDERLFVADAGKFIVLITREKLSGKMTLLEFTEFTSLNLTTKKYMEVASGIHPLVGGILS